MVNERNLWKMFDDFDVCFLLVSLIAKAWELGAQTL